MLSIPVTELGRFKTWHFTSVLKSVPQQQPCFRCCEHKNSELMHTQFTLDTDLSILNALSLVFTKLEELLHTCAATGRLNTEIAVPGTGTPPTWSQAGPGPGPRHCRAASGRPADTPGGQRPHPRQRTIALRLCQWHINLSRRAFLGPARANLRDTDMNAVQALGSLENHI